MDDCTESPMGDNHPHRVKTSSYYHRDTGYAGWLVCVDCRARLWGLHRIEEDLW